MLNQRHYLAHFDADQFAALKPAILSSVLLREVPYDLQAAMEVILEGGPIPGIVCRPATAPGDRKGQVGFSFPLKAGATRVRSSAIVHEDQVLCYSSPWDVTAQAIRSGMADKNPALSALVTKAQTLDIDIGLIGSWAMQVMTGLSYTHKRSDLDIVINAPTPELIPEISSIIFDMQAKYKIKIDCEILFQEKYGVKLNEYAGENDYILCKTINGIDLLSRSASIFQTEGGNNVDVKAKMPSVVISVAVSVGDEVSKGDALGEVEAMKMKNKVLCPADGKVTAVHIAEGDRVKPGGVMFTVE